MPLDAAEATSGGIGKDGQSTGLVVPHSYAPPVSGGSDPSTPAAIKRTASLIRAMPAPPYSWPTKGGRFRARHARSGDPGVYWSTAAKPPPCRFRTCHAGSQIAVDGAVSAAVTPHKVHVKAPHAVVAASGIGSSRPIKPVAAPWAGSVIPIVTGQHDAHPPIAI